jgi:hypothetical protein
LLNRKYYACRLTTYRRWNLAFEIALAVGTSGTIGAWAIWKNGDGQYVWTFIAGAAAILALLKPILTLPKQIERYTRLFSGYSDLFYDLEQLSSEARITKSLSKEMIKSYGRSLDRYRKLAGDDDAQPDEPLRRKCYEEVLKEIPTAGLWVPAHASPGATGGSI